MPRIVATLACLALAPGCAEMEGAFPAVGGQGPDAGGSETAADRAALPAPVAGGTAGLPAPQAPAPEGGEDLAALPSPAVGLGDDEPSRARLENPAEVVAPHIYMALQPDSAGAVSVVFAIDSARDGTPSDDPAIRLSPEAGQCNPQELSRFRFEGADAERPVFSEREARAPVTAAMLPDFMAVTVTDAMLAAGLAAEREDTRPQNVCTRKLWEQLVTAGVGGSASAAGQ